MGFDSSPLRRFRWVPLALISALALAGGAAALGLHSTDRVMIAYVGTLSGPGARSDLQCADGVTLAAEECNAAGGIRGSRLELQIRDDRCDPDEAGRMVNALADAGCWAVIGPTHAAVAPPVAQTATARNLLVVSPVVSIDASPDGRESYTSLRISSSAAAEIIARHVRYRRGLQRSAIVIGDNAPELPENIDRSVAQALATAGAGSVGVFRPQANGSPDYGQLAKRVIGSGADNVLLFAGGAETALFLQHLRDSGSDMPAIAYEPSSLQELLALSGKASDQLTVIAALSPEFGTERFRNFVDHFKKRFGQEPDLAAMYGYEAARLAIDSISQSRDRGVVRRAMLSRQWFDGLQGRISIGASGTPMRELRLVQVQGGELLPLQLR